MDGHPAIGCPSKIIFGIPCPGCGLTRATLALIHGHPGDAICLNPNILLILPFLIAFYACFAVDVVFNRLYTVKLWEKSNALLKKPWLLICLLVAEAALWIFNLYRF